MVNQSEVGVPLPVEKNDRAETLEPESLAPLNYRASQQRVIWRQRANEPRNHADVRLR